MNPLLRCIVCVAVIVPAIGATTRPSTTRSATTGPVVVVLKELESLYKPVAFDHKSHAKMAEMWQGCTTCHHRQPGPTTQASQVHSIPNQNDSAGMPACKSCHPKAEQTANIHLPSLKAAYHRQCLNCHREWMHDNACLICHEPADTATVKRPNLPTPDDLTGRMHPPIPEPTTQMFRARFSAADGRNVLFRHNEHARSFGLKCADCHHEDSCSSCHYGVSGAGPKPVKVGKTWAASHEPCASCHKEDRCRKCHYQDGQAPPPAFDHAVTGQVLDKDHNKLICRQCHTKLKSKVDLTCDGTGCHSKGLFIEYPYDRPGPVVAKPVAASQPTTRPTSTMPTIERIRAAQGGGK